MRFDKLTTAFQQALAERVVERGQRRGRLHAAGADRPVAGRAEVGIGALRIMLRHPVETLEVLGQHDGGIAGVILELFVLFVAGFVLFIENDQAELVERAKQGRARANQNVAPAFDHAPPLVGFLARGEMRVQDRHLPGKAA